MKNKAKSYSWLFGIILLSITVFSCGINESALQGSNQNQLATNSQEIRDLGTIPDVDPINESPSKVIYDKANSNLPSPSLGIENESVSSAQNNMLETQAGDDFACRNASKFVIGDVGKRTIVKMRLNCINYYAVIIRSILIAVETSRPIKSTGRTRREFDLFPGFPEPYRLKVDPNTPYFMKSNGKPSNQLENLLIWGTTISNIPESWQYDPYNQENTCISIKIKFYVKKYKGLSTWTTQKINFLSCEPKEYEPSDALQDANLISQDPNLANLPLNSNLNSDNDSNMSLQASNSWFVRTKTLNTRQFRALHNKMRGTGDMVAIAAGIMGGFALYSTDADYKFVLGSVALLGGAVRLYVSYALRQMGDIFAIIDDPSIGSDMDAYKTLKIISIGLRVFKEQYIPYVFHLTTEYLTDSYKDKDITRAILDSVV
jgi:hypothetical protein